ncbi:MAG: hypothetical protein NTV68_06650 [Methanomicrobiales archaeon]|nr:hypothetical protein [Methanomicrobiales archaeon]
MKKTSETTINHQPAADMGTDIRGEDISPRTWILFYLICLVAILWATFLLVREEMIWLSFALVIIAAGSGMFLFIHNIKLRTGFFFYLICLVAILWAAFLLLREEMVWVSAFLFLVSAGMVVFAYFLGEHHHQSIPVASPNPEPVANPGNPAPVSSEKTSSPMDPEEE